MSCSPLLTRIVRSSSENTASIKVMLNLRYETHASVRSYSALGCFMNGPLDLCIRYLVQVSFRVLNNVCIAYSCTEKWTNITTPLGASSISGLQRCNTVSDNLSISLGVLLLVGKAKAFWNSNLLRGRLAKAIHSRIRVALSRLWGLRFLTRSRIRS